MQYIIAGLGNPGEEYEGTRHNAGRMAVLHLAEQLGVASWRDDKTLRAKVAQTALPNGDTLTLVLPDNYMNRSGGALAPLVKNAKQAERLIVVHDDIDLPLGTLRIVFDRGAGGHRGVESVERALKTKAFVRVRVGVLPVTPGGKPKKPKGDAAIHEFILAPLRRADSERLGECVVRAAKAALAVACDGREAAMREHNGGVAKKAVRKQTRAGGQKPRRRA